MINELTPAQAQILNSAHRLICALSNQHYLAINHSIKVDHEIDFILMFLKDISPNLQRMIEHYKIHGNLETFIPFTA